VIEPHTRTAMARAALGNPHGLLRANMYARARILDPGEAGVLVPRAAVQDARGVKLVFVQLASDKYEARRVKPVAAENGMMAIASGVRPRDMVVTTGSFLLKTETLKESIGAGCCEVEPPKKK
jgi:cobalt-zinc-cadmium efflux system membrane fusion protein